MKITRVVNGVEMRFELTESELVTAYYKWQNMIDKEDIQSVLDEENMSVTNEQLDLIADAFRDLLYIDETWRAHARNAIEQVLKKEKKQ